MSFRPRTSSFSNTVVLNLPGSTTVTNPGQCPVLESNFVSMDNVIAFKEGVVVAFGAPMAVGAPNEKMERKEDEQYRHAQKVLAENYTVHEGMAHSPYQPFKPLDQITDDDDISVRAPGQGQTKLISGEVRFFETYYKYFNNTDRQFGWNHGKYSSVVMYIGASDGHHISQFTVLYPETLFVLVDPRNPHWGLTKGSFPNLLHIKQAWTTKEHVDNFLDGNLNANNTTIDDPGRPHSSDFHKPHGRIYIPPSMGGQRNYNTGMYQGLVTQMLDTACPVLFISDIRSVDTRSMEEEQGDEGVSSDQEAQHIVLEAFKWRVNVVAYDLKFRAPYNFQKGGGSIETTPLLKRTKGELWIQPYAPGSSTEMRIVSKCSSSRALRKPLEYESYNPRYLEEVMSYVNTVLRVKKGFDAREVTQILKLVKRNHLDGQLATTRLKHIILHYNIPVADKESIKLA